MILGNASWGFREIPLEKQLEITRSNGLKLLELGIGGHANDFLQLNASDEDIAKVKELFSQYEIELVCASTGNDFTETDAKACEESAENVKKVIEIASKLGIKYLRIFAGFSPVSEITGERWERMMKCLNDVLKHGQKFNVLPAIETHGGVEEYLDGIRHFPSTTTDKAVFEKLISELEYPLGIVFDPANLGAVGMNSAEVIEWYECFKLQISFFHLKDFAGTAGGAIEPCACGEGQLDWEMIWKTVKSSPCPGLIEYEIPESVEQGIETTLNNFRKYEA